MIENNRRFVFIAFVIQTLLNLLIVGVSMAMGFDLLQSLGILFVLITTLDFVVVFIKGAVSGFNKVGD